jgi:hypothetical protein
MRAEFWAERVRMMQFWSDYLEDLRDRVEPPPSSPAPSDGRPVFGAPLTRQTVREPLAIAGPAY